MHFICYFDEMSLLPSSYIDLKSICNTLLDMLYPPACMACGQELFHQDTRVLCNVCLSSVSPFYYHDRPPKLFLGYHKGPLRKVIKDFKRGDSKKAVQFLSSLLGRLVKNTYGRVDGLLAVPSSKNTIEGREPAQIIAAEVSRTSGIELLSSSLLYKSRLTKKQAYLSVEQRWRNLQDSFKADQSLHNCELLLIDDVMTTGATIIECTKAVESVGGKIFGTAFLAKRPLFVYTSNYAIDQQFLASSTESSS